MFKVLQNIHGTKRILILKQTITFLFKLLFLSTICNVLDDIGLTTVYISFFRFSKDHNFVKPNDDRSLNLMTHAAKVVMQNFTEIVLAYGQSDEYSFVFRKKTETYNRRARLAPFSYLKCGYRIAKKYYCF